MKRIDLLLVENQQAKSRTEAQKMIAAKQVQVCEASVWRVVKKPSEKFDPATEFNVQYGEEQKYVSRAGLKLEAALKQQNICVEGALALDVGQSTGGFSDCLLKHGAAKVIGIEVGRDQLDKRLRLDERVLTLEQYNARNLQLQDLPDCAQQGVDIIVMDVSFISQHLILPQLPPLLKKGGYLLSLVKPQFEAGKDNIGKNGIVRDPAVYAQVERRLRDHLAELGFSVEGYLPSPIEGGDGNREFLVVAKTISRA